MNYETTSDFELNKRLAELLGFGVDEGYGFTDSSGSVVCYDLDCSTLQKIEARVNYCKNPSDMWPIIVDLEIGILPDCSSWVAVNENLYAFGGADYFKHMIIDKNPLRAAVIIAIQVLEDGV